MLKTHYTRLSLVAAAMALALPVMAQEGSAGDATADAQPQASADEIAGLVERLDSNQFTDRQAASEKLTAIGQPAIAAVAEAAVGESLEVTVRSIDILRKLADSDEEKVTEEAKAALEQIAESDRPSAARRAKDALKALEPPEQPRNALIQGGAIQINVAAGGMKKINVKTVNGVKEINAEEGDRKVKIVDDPKAGIKMEVTTKKNGKEVTEKYEAKDEKELKKKHPEAHKIYKEYDKAGGGMMFRMQIGGGNVPIRVGRPQAVRPKRPNQLDSAGRMITMLGRHVKNLADDDAIQNASEDSRKDFAKKIAELKEQLGEVEQRLEKASEGNDSEAEQPGEKE